GQHPVLRGRAHQGRAPLLPAPPPAADARLPGEGEQGREGRCDTRALRELFEAGGCCVAPPGPPARYAEVNSAPFAVRYPTAPLPQRRYQPPAVTTSFRSNARAKRGPILRSRQPPSGGTVTTTSSF